MIEEGKCICWDLDHTLGDFVPIMNDRRRFCLTTDPHPKALGLRKGISELLDRLQQSGYKHFLTTTGLREYANEVLTRTGIKGYFEEVYDREQVDAGLGKLYRPVANRVGFSDENARRDMVVLGDMKSDQPADIDGLVFLHQPNGFMYSASTITEVLITLNKLGEGNFNLGHQRLMERGNIISLGNMVLYPTLRSSDDEDKHWVHNYHIHIPSILILDSASTHTQPYHYTTL